MSVESKELTQLNIDDAHELAKTLQNVTESIPQPTAQTYDSLLEIYDRGKDDAKREQNKKLFEGFTTKEQLAFSIFSLVQRLANNPQKEAQDSSYDPTPILALWAFDINGLKIFNDEFADHSQGDILISSIQQAFANSFRLPNEDQAARLTAGDEIGLVNTQNVDTIDFNKKISQLVTEIQTQLKKNFADVPKALELIKKGSGSISGGLQLFSKGELVSKYKNWQSTTPVESQNALSFFSFLYSQADAASFIAKKISKGTLQTEIAFVRTNTEGKTIKEVRMMYEGLRSVSRWQMTFNKGRNIFYGIRSRL